MPIPIPAPDEDELPVPYPPPLTQTGPRPYYMRQTQDWAIEQERQRHNQALYQLGEWVFFVLMWTQVDFERGLVTRCSRCYGNATPRAARIAAVYDQPIQNECPICFGTTFEGGYRARIVRPAMVTDVEEKQRQDRKGTMHPANVSIQSTVDFRARNGDYMIRADNSRWQLGTPERTQVRTGFEHPGQITSGTAYSAMSGKLEEHSTVAYKLPPILSTEVRTTLTQYFRMPGDFSTYEDVVGPLVPPGVFD